MILKNLLRRKTRTLLTLLGIAIGVAGVVALGAIAEGYINTYTTVLTSSGADVILAQGDAVDLLLSAVQDNVLPVVQNTPGVKQVAGILWGIFTTEDIPYFFVIGLDPKEFAVRHFRVVEGSPIASPRQMLMGRAAAKALGKKIGENFKIHEVSYRIVGLYETGQAIEEMGAVITLKEAQEVFKKPRQVTYYQIQVTRPEMTDAVIQALKRHLPKLAASRSANYMDDQQTTMMLRAMSWVISLLALLAGGLVMMNTMLMSVFERTREIGVLRAVGWSSGRVLRMILGEAVALSIAGGIVGFGIGALLVLWLNQIPAILGMLENTLSFNLFLQAMVVALILGGVGGAYPARRAARLQPVEAMRYEGGSPSPRSHKAQAQFSLQLPLFTSLSPALRNIFRQRTRTILTALAIGVGVGLVVALGGMADGFSAQLSEMGVKSGELTVTEAKASDMGLAAIDAKIGRWIAALPAVQSVSGLLLNVAQVPGTPYFLVLGIDPSSYALRHFAITEGTYIRGPREMMLGKMTAQNYKKRVGNTLQVSGVTYRVVGIYETGVGYEDGASVIALSEAQALFKKPNQVSFYFVKLRDPSQADVVRQQVEARWKQVSVSKSTEYAEKMNDIQVFRTMAAALSFLSIVIGGVGIMNAMLMSVFERTREIGTLRALGWRRRRVIAMIVRESLALSLVSGLAGIGMGVGVGWLVTLEPTMGVYLQGEYSLRLFAQAMVVALVLGGLGALYPAWRAANLSPAEALRYE